MSLQRFRATRFRPDVLRRIEQAQEILAEYPGQRLTARQIYYQFVARDLIANEQRNYALITRTLVDARYAGMIDWDAIEDRGRVPDSPAEWETGEALVETALRAFRLPRWRGQKHYLELWVEKQALAGVLAPIARKWHVTLLVNKGYSSASAMKAAADRINEAVDFGAPATVSRPEGRGLWKRIPTILYLGDHDPSGEDMVRDIRTRLYEFNVENLTVTKLALTMRQIQQFQPPPNFAKLTDSRAVEYIKKYGNKSWELDALPPRELTRITESAIRHHLDPELREQVVKEEDAIKAQLRSAFKPPDDGWERVTLQPKPAPSKRKKRT